MYILYLDESGDPAGWQCNHNFVLAGLAVHEGQVEALTARLDRIQAEFFPSIQFKVNLHAAAIHNGKDRFRDLVKAERERLMLSVYQAIAALNFPRLVVFATAINESCAVHWEQVLRDAFQDVCSRFNIFMRRQYDAKMPTKGLLIIDQAHEQRYERLFTEFKGLGTEFGPVNNIIDRPYFAHSLDTRMLQLADFCSYAVYRKYEASDPTYFDMILPKIDRRAASHGPDGLKHITKATCSCEACVWRGRSIPMPLPPVIAPPPPAP